MDKKKLNIRFHNPNSAEKTLKYMTKIFTDASRGRFERILKEAAHNSTNSTEDIKK